MGLTQTYFCDIIYIHKHTTSVMKHLPSRASVFIISASLFGAFFIVPLAEAATPLQAQVMSGDAQSIRLAPKQSLTVSVQIKNIGTTSWRASGSQFVALNTFDEKNDRTLRSKFQHAFWKKWWRPAGLVSAVKPGQTITIKLAIQAPNEVGKFTEQFSLAEAGMGFIKGSRFSLTVISFPNFTLRAPEVPRVEIEQGQTKALSLQFENTSKITWDAKRFPLALSVGNLKTLSAFTDGSWVNSKNPCALSTGLVKPGQKISCTILLKAPETPGSYRETFFVNAENMGEMMKSRFPVNISVTPKVSEIAAPRLVAGEPLVRVGLFSTALTSTFKANGILDIQDAKGIALGTISAGTIVNISSEAASIFSITTPDQNLTVASPVRFIPKDQITITEISSFERRPAWNSSLNDNTFRGTIEFRTLPASPTYWAIEELAMEEYLRGIAEVTGSENQTYIETLITAARTYATFLTLYKKHPNEGFDVNMTAGDQVYRGYNFELRAPNITKAVLATEGKIITHPYAVDVKNPNGVIVASYSSGTDGKTRRWCDVWRCGNSATDYPWAMSVPDPLGVISNALTLTGNHMVGLSARGAKTMAGLGKSMEEILKYYYTGVEIKKIY